jgi:hypothetical protein
VTVFGTPPSHRGSAGQSFPTPSPSHERSEAHVRTLLDVRQDEKGQFCAHRGSQRYLTDVWTIPEVVFALQHGYKLVRAHEALIYKEKAPIFKSFYAGLARMKLESEPLPANLTSVQEYVARLNAEMPWIELQAKI